MTMAVARLALAFMLACLALLVAACKTSGGSAVVVRPAQIAGSAAALPVGVTYLSSTDACAPQLIAHGASAQPIWVRSEREINGDGVPDVVVTDQSQCDARGNCRWQLFISQAGTCPVHVGELAGATLAVVENDEKPMRLQGLWHLADNRVLRHEYRMVDGRYELAGVTVCRLDADVVACAPPMGH